MSAPERANIKYCFATHTLRSLHIHEQLEHVIRHFESVSAQEVTHKMVSMLISRQATHKQDVVIVDVHK
jgi:hypothetical protein